MYIPSFALPMYKTTCHAKPYIYMSVQYQLRDVNEGVGGRLIGYCFRGCCCRFCCGAPTTDERIHAPVLHDVSQIGLLQVLKPCLIITNY